MARLPFLRRLHLSFCVRITDAGLLALAGPASAAPGTAIRHCKGSSSAVASALAGTYGAQHWGITVRRTSSTGGWEHGSVPTSIARSASMGARAAALQLGAELAASQAHGGAAAGCRRLQELELYHCPQVGWAHWRMRTLAGLHPVQSVVAAPWHGQACMPCCCVTCSLVCPSVRARQSEPRQSCSSWHAAGTQTCAKPPLLPSPFLVPKPAQVTHRGLWALAEACAEVQHVNIGESGVLRYAVPCHAVVCGDMLRDGHRAAACFHG